MNNPKFLPGSVWTLQAFNCPAIRFSALIVSIPADWPISLACHVNFLIKHENNECQEWASKAPHLPDWVLVPSVWLAWSPAFYKQHLHGRASCVRHRVNDGDCPDLLSSAEQGCSATGRFCSLWDARPGCAFPRRKRETWVHNLQEWAQEGFPLLTRISLTWLMTHLCWNDRCCDEQKMSDLEALTHPSSCLGGWPGEGQCTGVGGLWRMHWRPHLLTDSTSCCWSAQPLASPVTSLLMKERSKMLLLQPMNPDLMLCRKAEQAEDWSPVTQMPLVLWSIMPVPRRKNLNVRAVKRITLCFLPPATSTCCQPL